MEKYLQAQFVTIPHGFTLGFRSDTSKPFSVVLCSTFSWRPPARPAGLERDWCASGCFCWAAPSLGLFQMSSVMHCVNGHGEGGSCRRRWGSHCRCSASTRSAIPCHYETPLPVALTRIPFGLWHFLSQVQCVLILWVLPFLLLAASRRHSRSTSALSTADSVGQSGEQALTAWIRFLIVVLFYTILTFAIVCISQHLACASHHCRAFCSAFVQRGFLFWVSFIGCF